jgi:hypothetical protein
VICPLLFPMWLRRRYAKLSVGQMLREAHMLRYGFVLVAFSFICMAGGPAYAEKVELSKRYSKDELKSACPAAGGTYTEGPGGYGCEKQCTSSGEYCTISCPNNSNSCYGDTPGRVLAGQRGITVEGVLSNSLGAGTNPPAARPPIGGPGGALRQLERR